MKLELYRNLWGMPGSRAESLAQIEQAGYHGVEAVLFSDEEARELAALLPRHRLRYKAVLWTKGRLVAEQLASLRAELTRAEPLKPDSISVIGGYDCWSDDEMARYFEGVAGIERETGRSFAHETHRNSALFHPGVTMRVLDRFPDLPLICDFSHWVLTCERLLDDQLETIRRCGRNAVHLHARVGSEQAPQLADLRAPEAAPYRDAFERWWEIVWEEQTARGWRSRLYARSWVRRRIRRRRSRTWPRNANGKRSARSPDSRLGRRNGSPKMRARENHGGAERDRNDGCKTNAVARAGRLGRLLRPVFQHVS